jgi:hypothetical protein
MFARLSAEKGSANNYHIIEKAKNKKQKNLPCSSYVKFIAVKKVQCPV